MVIAVGASSTGSAFRPCATSTPGRVPEGAALPTDADPVWRPDRSGWSEDDFWNRARPLVPIDPDQPPVGTEGPVRSGDPGGPEYPAGRRHPSLLLLQRHGSHVRHRGFDLQQLAGSIWRRRFLHRERTDAGSPQHLEMGPASEVNPHIRYQRPHVRAAGAPDPEVEPWRMESPQVEGVHRDATSGCLQETAFPSRAVEPLSSYLHGRVRRGPLLELAHERVHRRTKLLFGHIHRHLPDHLAGRVQRRRLDAEDGRPLIQLWELAEEPEEPGGSPYSHDEKAGGGRVERSGVSDLPRVQRSPHHVHGVVRGDPGRLVD